MVTRNNNYIMEKTYERYLIEWTVPSFVLSEFKSLATAAKCFTSYGSHALKGFLQDNDEKWLSSSLVCFFYGCI